jgi:argininosuccinate lyase
LLGLLGEFNSVPNGTSLFFCYFAIVLTNPSKVKLWQKENSKKTNDIIEKFTVGRDRELDIHLAPFDLLGSMAHSIMLERIQLLDKQELKVILKECKKIYNEEIKEGKFTIIAGMEDVHSQIEFSLTSRIP